MPTITRRHGFFFPQQDAHNATVSHVYTFDAGDTANGAYNVTVTDRATNQTTVPFTVTRDIIAPTVTFALPERIAASDIPVQWSASDAGSGVQHYDVEYQIANGDWTPWLTATAQTQATFTGTLGVAYTFRVRATDNVSNVSTWAQAEARTVVVKKYYSVAGQRVAMRSNGVLYYLHGDHLGSTSLTTNESGNVVAEQRYYPYGEVRWVTGTLPTDFGFTGQRAEDFGLMDYRARFYSGRLGRFVSADSIVPGAGGAAQNRYMYVEGNPLKYVDPSGHCAGLTGMAFRVCKAMVMTAAQVVHKANEYREDIFFPDENTTFLERLEASTVVGLGATAVAVGTTWAVKKVASYAITHPKKAYTGRAFAEEAYEAAVTGTPFDPGMVLLDLASAGILDDTLPRRQKPSGSDFSVTPDGVVIPQNRQVLYDALSSYDDVSTNPSMSRKFSGIDSQGQPIRIRIERAHADDPNFIGVPDPLHTVDHLHIERRTKIFTGNWYTRSKIGYEWSFE